MSLSASLKVRIHTLVFQIQTHNSFVLYSESNTSLPSSSASAASWHLKFKPTEQRHLLSPARERAKLQKLERVLIRTWLSEEFRISVQSSSLQGVSALPPHLHPTPPRALWHHNSPLPQPWPGSLRVQEGFQSHVSHLRALPSLLPRIGWSDGKPVWSHSEAKQHGRRAGSRSQPPPRIH